jgi:hypothetical protein
MPYLPLPDVVGPTSGLHGMIIYNATTDLNLTAFNKTGTGTATTWAIINITGLPEGDTTIIPLKTGTYTANKGIVNMIIPAGTKIAITSNLSSNTFARKYPFSNTFPNTTGMITWLGCYRGSSGIELDTCEQALEIYSVEVYAYIGETIIPPSYYVNNVQTPNDINTTSFQITINTSIINLTSVNNITNDSYTEIYYKPYTNLSTCSVYYGKACYLRSDEYNIVNMTKINNTYYTISLDDTELLPAYYPFDYYYIDNNPGLNYTLYHNNNVKFNMYNFTTSSEYFFLDLEFDAINKTSETSSMIIYYCNSSYTTGSPLLSSNCEIITTFLPQMFNHEHNLSRHQVVNFQIRNITKTSTSYIIFTSPNLLQTNGWLFRYVTNSSYDNSSFNIGAVNSWTNTPNIFDIHVHTFKPEDYFIYYTKFIDGSSNTNSSIITYDFYNITQSAPTIPQFISPTCNTTYTRGGSETINLSWNSASDENNDEITYDINFYNSLNVLTKIYSGIETNTTYSVDDLENNYYNMQIQTCDEFDNCAYGDLSCNINICTNDWTNTTSVCVANSQLLTVIDSNNCPSKYNIPIYNNTYIECETPATKIIYEFSDEQIIMLSLFLFIIISIACGVLLAPMFFYISSMLTGLMIVTSIHFNHNPVILIAEILFTIMFIITAIFYKRK